MATEGAVYGGLRGQGSRELHERASECAAELAHGQLASHFSGGGGDTTAGSGSILAVRRGTAVAWL